MKLVEILARELREWPGVRSISQGAQCFLRDEANYPLEIQCELASDWVTAIVTRAQWQEAREALINPKNAQWNGEGLPPAGTVCERRTHADAKFGRYEEVKIIAHTSKGFPVWENTNALFAGISKAPHTVGCHPEFRPIRTPEQLAAEARESGARQICIDAMADPFDEPTESQMTVARRLYDKGYRIFEIVDEAKEQP